METDYLVVGAGAMGMAFTDALIDHADVHVTLVDRRLAPSGHWLDAYPFVQLHQASLFYGVASTTRRRTSIRVVCPDTRDVTRCAAPSVWYSLAPRNATRPEPTKRRWRMSS